MRKNSINLKGKTMYSNSNEILDLIITLGSSYL